ncbi:MAG: hypothetical protein JSS03_02490 [Proteobacteria bacterium]|nr:hypothetical protein [Pseudomonadota bacterium]
MMLSYTYDNTMQGKDMSTAAIRINARLTGDDARRFIELTEGKDALAASDLLREALREYHARHAPARPDAFKLMQASGFIGGFDTVADLSSRYKEYLTGSLDGKHPQAVNEPASPRHVAKKAAASQKRGKAVRK